MREAQRAAGADPDLVRSDPPAAPNRLGADHRDRHDWRGGLEREPADAAPRLAERPGADARALGKDQNDVAPGQDRLGGVDHVGVTRTPVDREGAERVEDPRLPPACEQLLLGHVVHRPAGHRRDHEGVEEAPVVRGDDHRTLGGDVLAPDAAQPEVQVKERLKHRAQKPVEHRIGPFFARAPV